MTKAAFSQLSFNDIVFEGRNKRYGAYLLRTIYHKHLFQATVIAISCFILFLSLPLIAKMFAPNEVPVLPNAGEKPHKITKVVLPPTPSVVPPAPVEPPVAAPKTEITKHTPPKIVSNNTPVTDEIPNNKDLQGKTTGTENIAGQPPTLPNQASGDGTGTATVTAPAEIISDEVFKSVEQMPVFRSGVNELMEYLRNNFKYPERAKRVGLNGTLFVSFTITKTGEVTDVKVLKGLGFGVDEEAVRVISSMPKWTPGKQNGREVSVSYTVPFKLNLK